VSAALRVPGRRMDESVLWVAGQGRVQELIEEAGVEDSAGDDDDDVVG